MADSSFNNAGSTANNPAPTDWNALLQQMQQQNFANPQELQTWLNQRGVNVSGAAGFGMQGSDTANLLNTIKSGNLAGFTGIMQGAGGVQNIVAPSQTNQLQNAALGNYNQASGDLQKFIQSFSQPPSPSDPMYQSIMKSAASAASGQAANQGISGPSGLSVANTQMATANALAPYELQRQEAAANAASAMGNLGVGGGQLALGQNAFNYQAAANQAASAGSPGAIVGGVAGGTLGAVGGFFAGGPAGAAAGASGGAALGSGLGRQIATPGLPSSPYSIGGGGGGFSGNAGGGL